MPTFFLPVPWRFKVRRSTTRIIILPIFAAFTLILLVAIRRSITPAFRLIQSIQYSPLSQFTRPRSIRPDPTHVRSTFSEQFNIPALKGRAAGLTENNASVLYILPGSENRCGYRFNYFCKFWFYLRCYVFAVFPNVEMLSPKHFSIAEFQAKARDGDIALIAWRSRDHTEIPHGLMELLQWRAQNDGHPQVKIGVFHTGNELNRTDWQWYSQPDFILRNYWAPTLPTHVAYIPLGPQFADSCAPITPQSVEQDTGYAVSTCACKGSKPSVTSTRHYLWCFVGSLRERRAELVAGLQKSASLRGRGYLQIAEKFGGDGRIGGGKRDPKHAYLDAVRASQFVFAPCGNVMETHRIYEALSVGAIPVIENCEPQSSDFFPFPELLVDGGPQAMIKFVEEYADKPQAIDELQERVMEWWTGYSEEIGGEVSATIRADVPASERDSM